MSSGVIKCQKIEWKRLGKGKNVVEKQMRMMQKKNKRMGTNIKGRADAVRSLSHAEQRELKPPENFKISDTQQ